jgi:hypothetical protein
MSWFYISPTQERLPFTESEIPTLVRSGVLQAQTQVWQPEQDGWMAASEVSPSWFQPSSDGSAPDGAAPVKTMREMVGPLLAQRAWFVITGVFLVLAAVLVLILITSSFVVGGTFEKAATLTLLPCGILWIFGGVGIIRALGGVVRATELGQPSVLEDAFTRLGRAVAQVVLGIILTLLLVAVWVTIAMIFWGRLTGPLAA